MSKGFYHVPVPKNEPVLNYAPGSKERTLLKKALQEARAQVLDIPMYIGADEVRSGKKVKLSPPHDHQHVLGYYHEAKARRCYFSHRSEKDTRCCQCINDVRGYGWKS